VFYSPYFGEEFEFEVPRLFRFLAVYVRDNVGPGTSRVIGKVALRRQHLSNIHDKDHWFPLKPVDADSEVQVCFIHFSLGMAKIIQLLIISAGKSSSRVQS